EVAPLQVVEPRALAELFVEADEMVHHEAPSKRAVAWATTLSTLIPNLSSTISPGALAPNRSMPTESSAQRDHPNVAAASTDRRGTPAGKTSRWYSSGCTSKRSHDGIDTTRAATPVASSAWAASRHTATSLPVPMRTI